MPKKTQSARLPQGAASPQGATKRLFSSAYRTHTCGALRVSDVGKQVTLSGWVNARRDHGGLIFIDLRDRYGITQVRFDPQTAGSDFKIADSLRSEFVITISGAVAERPQGMRNDDLATGAIEVNATTCQVINPSKTPPFEIDRETPNLDEEVRLKYRYLDLRHQRLQRHIALRSEVMHFVRQWLRKQDFLEIETPVMGRETPEGARDYVVPARLYPGEFYALAQSPQQYKQLLMVAGFDRYFQLPKVFRDEDPRADRVPEHTQIDIEMSFVQREDVLQMVEALITDVAKQFSKARLASTPFVRLPFEDAMRRFGTDKPDITFGLEIRDVNYLKEESSFKIFKDAQAIQAVVAPRPGFSRKEIDQVIEFAKSTGAPGLAWLKMVSKELDSPIAKFLPDQIKKKLVEDLAPQEGDVIFFAADEGANKALETIGRVRSYLGEKLSLKKKDVLAFAWIYDFPMFEWNPDERRVQPMHHMFTQPYEESVPLIAKAVQAEQLGPDAEVLKTRAHLYDLVLNGFELCSGSIRIWQPKLQRDVMKLIGLSDQDIESKFGHMLRAFEYGAPPHGGVGIGLDRVVALLAGETAIREVIAFPMNSRARDPMTEAPSPISDKQLQELHIQLKKSKS